MALCTRAGICVFQVRSRIFMSVPAIAIEKLTKVYRNGTRALKQVDLTIEEGDFFALLGANGAGKTTLISILTGLVNKTSGKAEIFGASVEREPSRAKT